MWFVALAMLAQSVGIGGYVLGAGNDGSRLVMPDGSYEVRLGPGCEFLYGNTNVEVIYGSQSSVVLIADDQRCPALMGYPLDDVPCVQNADGICDLTAAN